ncbi:MAG: winged helix-turn-helix transcriptional regulator [Pikeienuella sp.]
MSRSDLAKQTCTVARAVEIVGDPWTLMILREMFLGGRRFDDIQRQISVAPHTLSSRLKRLEGVGVIRREAYSERPVRYEYRLTEMGRDLWPAIIALKNWGDKWFDKPYERPIEIIHKNCGHSIQPGMACPECGEPMGALDAYPAISTAYEQEREKARNQK